MSDETASRFPKLNNANYAKWNLQMEAELIRKGLWGMVEIAVETEGKDDAAIAAEMQTKKNPMEIWQTLRSVHRARRFATAWLCASDGQVRFRTMVRT